jgi:LacI family transcriptional regulator
VACRRLQVNMLLATVPVDASNQPVDLPRVLIEGETDGLLLVGAFVDATISRLLRSRPAPAVLVDGYAEENGYDSVVSDNFRGAHQAVAHLLQHGHRRVAVVASQPDSYPSIAERRRGAVQALREQGIEPIFADSPLGREPAAEAVARLMGATSDVTALFCCNDESAIGALEALRGLGRDVPGDVSLVGFDDIDLAAHVVPALTTMQVDKVSMGRLAVQLLANRVEYPASGHVSLVLGPRLVERRSVRSLGGA